MITPDRLREVLHYEPTTGLFMWRVKASKKTIVGTVAGCLNSAGYVGIGIDRRTYLAHRLAWLYMTGEWPQRIDHENGNRSANQWANLRLATARQNGLNAKIAKTNTSGFKGVSWHKGAGRWAAHTHIMGTKIHLGLFDDPAAAHAAYVAACAASEPEFTREK